MESLGAQTGPLFTNQLSTITSFNPNQPDPLIHSRRLTYSNSQASIGTALNGAGAVNHQNMKSTAEFQQNFFNQINTSNQDINDGVDSVQTAIVHHQNQPSGTTNISDNILLEGLQQNEQKNIKDEVFIKVSTRVRPLLEQEQNHEEVIEVNPQKNCLKVYTNNYFNNGERNFYFEQVYDNQSSQQDIFQNCGKELCDAFLQGKNCNIIVYGPTSTGKTFTMQGDTQSKGSLVKSMFEGIINSHQSFGKLENNHQPRHKKTLSNHLVKTNAVANTRLQKSSFINNMQHDRQSSSFPCASILTSKEQSYLYSVIGNDSRGLIPRVMDYIYQNANLDTEKFEFRISFLEIYNDVVTDLLDSDQIYQHETIRTNLNQVNLSNRMIKGGQSTYRQHQVKENAQKGVYVENLTEHSANSIEEAYIFFLYGLQRKKIFATVKNRESSRSHTIFQIKLCSKPTKQRPQMTVVSKFSLVDLAGSERLSEGEKTLERIEEAKFINKSLSALGNVIYALKNHQTKVQDFQTKRNGQSRERKPPQVSHIPYRDSKLTHILKDGLGGNSHTHIIITLSPSIQSLQETLSSMKFAHNAKSIKQHIKENVFLKDFDNDNSDSFDSRFNDRDNQSVNSEDLIEISKYYDKRENFKCLKSEISEAKRKLKKLPKNQKMLRLLFRKTLDKLMKYKNDHVTLQEKILDLQNALELKDMLSSNFKDYLNEASENHNTLENNNSQQIFTNDLEKRLSDTFSKNPSVVFNNKMGSRSLKDLKSQIINQSKKNLNENQETEIMSLSQTVGDELSKLIENLKDDTIQQFQQQSILNIQQLLQNRSQLLNENQQIQVLDSRNPRQKQKREEKENQYDSGLDSMKASIDQTDMIKSCIEEQKISQSNISKIEEPLIYKTMNNCFDQHFNYLQTQFSAYFTPKQQSILLGQPNRIDKILLSCGDLYSNNKKIQSARASHIFGHRLVSQPNINSIATPPLETENERYCEKVTPRIIDDFSNELSRDHNMIPISQIWKNSLQDSLFDKSSNQIKISNIQSERSNQGKHFNFLDQSSNCIIPSREDPNKQYASNTSQSAKNQSLQFKNMQNQTGQTSAVLKKMMDDVSFETTHQKHPSFGAISFGAGSQVHKSSIDKPKMFFNYQPGTVDASRITAQSSSRERTNTQLQNQKKHIQPDLKQQIIGQTMALIEKRNKSLGGSSNKQNINPASQKLDGSKTSKNKQTKDTVNAVNNGFGCFYSYKRNQNIGQSHSANKSSLQQQRNTILKQINNICGKK